MWRPDCAAISGGHEFARCCVGLRLSDHGVVGHSGHCGGRYGGAVAFVRTHIGKLMENDVHELKLMSIVNKRRWLRSKTRGFIKGILFLLHNLDNVHYTSFHQTFL